MGDAVSMMLGLPRAFSPALDGVGDGEALKLRRAPWPGAGSGVSAAPCWGVTAEASVTAAWLLMETMRSKTAWKGEAHGGDVLDVADLGLSVSVAV